MEGELHPIMAFFMYKGSTAAPTSKTSDKGIVLEEFEWHCFRSWFSRNTPSFRRSQPGKPVAVREDNRSSLLFEQQRFEHWLEQVACRPGCVELSVCFGQGFAFHAYVDDASNVRNALRNSPSGWFQIVQWISHSRRGKLRARVWYYND
jgi:hypothetical protein